MKVKHYSPGDYAGAVFALCLAVVLVMLTIKLGMVLFS